jgi:hypothetical protein
VALKKAVQSEYNKRFKFDSKSCHAFCGAKIKANFLHNLSGRWTCLASSGMWLYDEFNWINEQYYSIFFRWKNGQFKNCFNHNSMEQHPHLTSPCISLRPHKLLAAVALRRWAVMLNIVPMATFVAYFIIPADIGVVPSANMLRRSGG